MISVKKVGYFPALAIFASILVIFNPTRSFANPELQSYLIAQSDPDEAYDPFSDYSEFDEASDEEADINFFRNGRFFTVGLMFGSRGYTDNMASIYNQAPVFGIGISYFFDLRLAFALGLMTGDSAMNFKTVSSGNPEYTGTMSLTAINMDLKYYFNTQNVTRGLADLNPYLLAGFSRISRTQSIPALNASGSDPDNMGADIGIGLEIPLLKRKSFLGIQATYHYINFSDESKPFIIDQTGAQQRLEKTFSGDFYDIVLTLGMNF